MARKPKIQGAISPELKQQWDEWKKNNNIESDGEGLTKILNSYFGLDFGLDNDNNELLEKIKVLEEKISKIDKIEQEVETIKKI